MTTNPDPKGPYIPAQGEPRARVLQLRSRRVRAPNEPSAATRHLSAGAYLDEDFCRESLAEVYNQKRRLVAPSYGFDLATVLWHCQQARRINLVRDTILVGVFLLGLCVNPVGVLVAGAVLLAVHLGLTAWRLSRDFLTQIREGNTTGQLQVAMRAGYLGAGATVLLTLVVVAAGLAVTPALGEGFSYSTNEQQQAEVAIATLLSFGGTLLIIAVFFGAPIGAELWRQTKLARLIPGKAKHVNVTGGRLQEIRWQEQGNMTVYSGFRPFVGAGDEFETTGFALRMVAKEQDPQMPLLERQREFDQPPFTAVELIGHLRTRLIELANDARPERRIPGLVVTDRVFMAGTEVNTLSPYIQPGDVENVIIPEPTGPIRHYLSAQVQSWDGEVVTTVYLHVALQGRTLYLETSTWVLAPCDNRFRSIDYIDNQGNAQFFWASLRGLVQAPRTAARCGINLARAGVESIAGWLSSKNSSGQGFETGFDHGARFSVRERGSLGLARNQFQVQDAVKYKRIIERRAVATVLDFLESRGVDTSEFRQRAAAILNQGTIIGSINNSQFHDISTVANHSGPAPMPEPREEAAAPAPGQMVVGVITVLAEETRAIIDMLKGHRGYARHDLPDHVRVHEAFLDGLRWPVRLTLLQTADRGQQPSASAFHYLRKHFEPTVFAIVGVAGSISQLDIGDVVVADSVIDYDNRMVREGGVDRRTQIRSSSTEVRGAEPFLHRQRR